MQQAYFLPYNHLYRGSPEQYSYLWPFSQALSAAVAMAGVQPAYLPAIWSLLGGLDHYWKAGKPPSYGSYVTGSLGQGGTTYYDDDEWVGLQLVRIYRMTGDRRALTRAQQILRLAISGWDTDRAHPCPGGVWWTQDPTKRSRNTVSNAPAAELGLALFEITGKRLYLSWAERFYSWVRGCLLEPNGLYEDNVTLEGTTDPTIWIYNQGTMLGADTLLYRVTGQPVYLELAKRGAAAALEYFDEERLQGQPSFFVSIFLDNLLLFEATSPGGAYREAIQRYADWAWQTARDPATGLFHFGREARYALLEQASMVQIYAFLGSGQTWYVPPPNAHRLSARTR